MNLYTYVKNKEKNPKLIISQLIVFFTSIWIFRDIKIAKEDGFLGFNLMFNCFLLLFIFFIIFIDTAEFWNKECKNIYKTLPISKKTRIKYVVFSIGIKILLFVSVGFLIVY